ncbi:MAG: hypothetical protein SCK70_04425, partial [bacterium]|nr:hypothetical protein [bacterium]
MLKIKSFIIILAICFAAGNFLFAADEFVCGTTEGMVVQSVPRIGQVAAIVIYSCDYDASTYDLPDWYDDICDTNYQYSIPNYFKDISFGNHILTMTPYGRNDTECFVSNVKIDIDAFVQKAYFDDVMAQADAIIDFAEFDNDGPDGIPNSGDDDGYVDFLFFVVVNHGYGRGVVSAYNYTTEDDAAGGGKIKISSSKSNRNITGARLSAELILSHEYGHALGLPDLDHSGSLKYNHYAIGGFGLMVNSNGFDDRQGCINPWFRSSGSHNWQLGWIDPIMVSTLINHQIKDFQTEQELYLLPSFDADQYFCLTNHLQISGWELYWPGKGLLIWHVNKKGSTSDRRRKPIDIEAAHGLYVWNFSDTINTFQPDPETGSDSLDVRGVYEYRHHGSASCYFKEEYNENFDNNSNPSSKLYQYSSPYAQNIISHVAVKNIHNHPSMNNVIIADLSSNYWSNDISSNEIWSGQIYVGDDITVLSGVTLTIELGTTIKFASGTELKINGTLNAQGSSANPITFTSANASPAAGDWNWIKFDSGTGTLEYCNIEYARFGLWFYGAASDPTVENCTVENCSYYGA